MVTLTSQKVYTREQHGYTKLEGMERWHTFSFGNFQNPFRTGFRAIRVINDDRILAQMNGMMQGHRDMEILTYMVSGCLAQNDLTGDRTLLRAGDVQVLSAGTGVYHCDRQLVPMEEADQVGTRYLEIWLIPKRLNRQPSCSQKHFSATARQGKFCLVASEDGRDNSALIHQDVNVYAAILEDNSSLQFEVLPQRSAWLQVVRGKITFNDRGYCEGDGIAIDEPGKLVLQTEGTAEILLFDLG